jgi:endonuclease YncB( thermonuclease family)
MYEYKATLVRAVDGDTFDMIIDLGFGIMFGNKRCPQRFRLADYNAKEKNSTDEAERKLAWEAADFVQQFEGETVKVNTRKTKKGKERQTFGRFVADVAVWVPDRETNVEGWEDLGNMMLENGLVERWGEG